MLAWLGQPALIVNPARAGMIPEPARLAPRCFGKPRASGDDPQAPRAHEIAAG